MAFKSGPKAETKTEPAVEPKVEPKKVEPKAIRIKRATCPDGIRIGNDGTHRQLPPRGGAQIEDFSLLPGQLVTAVIGGERYVWSAARFDSIVLETSDG